MRKKESINVLLSRSVGRKEQKVIAGLLVKIIAAVAVAAMAEALLPDSGGNGSIGKGAMKLISFVIAASVAADAAAIIASWKTW